MIYSLRHQLRFVNKDSAKPVEKLVGEKYAIVCFSEDWIRSRSPFPNIAHSRMLEVLLPNSVLDQKRNLRWIKMAVHPAIHKGDPSYMMFSQSVLYPADFAALYNNGKHVLTYKNRDIELRHIPDEVHSLKTLHHFPLSKELETL